ncbi:MAG: hypothetical protein PVSMB8_00640 [Vulcanimicrobiaceae bacterium]
MRGIRRELAMSEDEKVFAGIDWTKGGGIVGPDGEVTVVVLSECDGGRVKVRRIARFRTEESERLGKDLEQTLKEAKHFERLEKLEEDPPKKTRKRRPAKVVSLNDYRDRKPVIGRKK